MSGPSPTGSTPEPLKPPSPQPLTPSGGGDSKYAFYLKSPWAKMFKATGVEPTVKEIKMIIDGVLQQVMNSMKQEEAETKKAEEHLKKVIEGQDD